MRITRLAFVDLAVLPMALAQQDRGRRIPVADGLDINGGTGAYPSPSYKSQELDYMAAFRKPQSTFSLLLNGLSRCEEGSSG
jgi:hypothetical protein